MKNIEVENKIIAKERWKKFGWKLFSISVEFFPKIANIIPIAITIEILIKFPS
jgi:hypothetical protein